MYEHPHGMGMFIHVIISGEKLIFIQKFDGDCRAILSPFPHMAKMTKHVISMGFFFFSKILGYILS